MELTDMKVTEFMNDLASDKPVPGGGSVSAVSGTMGMALGIMVASLTTGREKYAEHQDLMDSVFADGEKLKDELEALIDRDSAAYAMVMDSFKLPNKTDEEKAARSKAIHEGLIGAAEVPFEIRIDKTRQD